jgi:hypothetical protein
VGNMSSPASSPRHGKNRDDSLLEACRKSNWSDVPRLLEAGRDGKLLFTLLFPMIWFEFLLFLQQAFVNKIERDCFQYTTPIRMGPRRMFLYFLRTHQETHFIQKESHLYWKQAGIVCGKMLLP